MTLPLSIHIIRILFVLAGFSAFTRVAAQEVSVRSAAFYNVENFFDPENDPGTDDGDFTPEGIYAWTEERFQQKTLRIVQVLQEMAADIIGLAEVENAGVVEILTRHPLLLDLGFDYVHFDSPDSRGIDVALLYRRGAFRLESMQSVRYRELPYYRTREMLHVSGVWRGHPTHILVCHLPSVPSPKEVRNAAARSVRYYADSLLAVNPEHLLLVMGDFNANPDSRQMKVLTRGGSLVNPFQPLYRKGYGTYHYRGRWNMYDSILAGGKIIGETIPKIIIRDNLIQLDGQYKGYPFRSFSGTQYIGGYSDHLPVMLIFQ